MMLVIAFFTGFILGIIALKVLLRFAHHRGMRPHERDPHYGPAVRAVMRHLKAHGTVNLNQVEQMLSVNGVTGMRYVEHMELQGLIKSQKHKGTGMFYTLS